MARIESRILVPTTVEATFTFLGRRESHLNFIPRMTELRQTSPGDFGQVGATAKGTLNYFGVRIPVEYEVIELQLNQRLAMNGVMGPVRFTDGYILTAKDGGTELTFWLELHPTGWTKVLSPFAGLIGKFHAWETLRNLKRELNRLEEIATSLPRSSSQ